jgi:putative hemin transport protein
MSNEEAWIASFLAGPHEGGLSDLEALSLREDLRIMPLQRDVRALLEDLPSLGAVDCTTGNGGAICTRREAVRTVLPMAEGTTLLGDPGGLRWLEASWRHSAAVLSRGGDFTDTPPCLLFFGETGRLAHQITLPDPAAWEAFADLVRRHQGCWTCLRPQAERPGAPVPAECPIWLLRDAWCDSASDRDLDLRLQGLGLDRLLALRALEGLYTAPVPVEELASLLEGLAASGLPVHAQVGNRHCTQVLEAPIGSLVFGPESWDLRIAGATIRILPSSLDRVWSVVQPRRGGERHRFECYDARGERVLALSSPQDPCPLVYAGWQRAIGRLEGGPPTRG